MSSKKPIREMDTILIRVPDGMKDQIIQRATANGRSMSGEIVAILTELFEFPDEMGLRALHQKREELLDAEKARKRELDEIQTQLIAIHSELDKRIRATEAVLEEREREKARSQRS